MRLGDPFHFKKSNKGMIRLDGMRFSIHCKMGSDSHVLGGGKSHYTGSQREKQLNPDNVMTRFLMGAESYAGNQVDSVRARPGTVCF